MKIKNGLFILTLIFLTNSIFAGTFSPSIYGNFEGVYYDNTSISSTNAAWDITTNADWEITEAKAYFELKLAGKNIIGVDFWSKIGASTEYHKTDRSENFKLRQVEAHIEKSFSLLQGVTKFSFYRNQDRSDVGQTYLDFFGGLGEDANENRAGTRSGIQWDAYGLWGFYTKGFLLDYKAPSQDGDNKREYAIGGRIGRDIIKKPAFNWAMGVTTGGVMYYRKYGINDIFSDGYDIYTKYYYNVFGADTTINGDIPALGSYYFFFGYGRSYSPESYPLEYHPLIALTGNTNTSIFIAELKWNKKFTIGDTSLGQLFLAIYTSYKQPRFAAWLGGDGGNNFFNEKIDFVYHFPVKAVTLNGYFEYYHNYIFDSSKYHIWQAGEITDASAGLKKNLNLTVLFRSGFSFNIAWDNEMGKNYLGSFDPKGINYLTISTSGESSLGKISPQVKIVALGDTEKRLISSGIEILINLNSWFKFYSRFAYVLSAGKWKSGTDINWWTAFVQLQINSGSNSKIFLEIGDAGHTDSGFVSDVDLINGSSFNKKVYFKFEYWI